MEEKAYSSGHILQQPSLFSTVWAANRVLLIKAYQKDEAALSSFNM